MKYPIVVHKDKDSDYGVSIPDLPGCFSSGKTFEEALENAEEAILCHLEGLLADNEPLPKYVNIDTHKKNKEFSSGLWAIVSVDLEKLSGKTKRKIS